MISLQQAHEESKPKTKTTKRTNTFLDTIEAKAKGIEKCLLLKSAVSNSSAKLSLEYDDEANAKGGQQEMPQIDFAAWKRRMLEEAS